MCALSVRYISLIWLPPGTARWVRGRSVNWKVSRLKSKLLILFLQAIAIAAGYSQLVALEVWNCDLQNGGLNTYRSLAALLRKNFQTYSGFFLTWRAFRRSGYYAQKLGRRTVAGVPPREVRWISIERFHKLGYVLGYHFCKVGYRLLTARIRKGEHVGRILAWCGRLRSMNGSIERITGHNRSTPFVEPAD